MDFDSGLLIFIGIVLCILSGWVCLIVLVIKQRKEDNAAPLLVVEATVTEKRKRRKPTTRISSGYTRYYATFEFENDVRQEFIIGWSEYLWLDNGDVGRLTLKGRRYESFESVLMSDREKLTRTEAAKVFISKAIDDGFWL